MTKPRLILGIGELLWDLFPGGSRPAGVSIGGSALNGLLGGAPANFAYMTNLLGDAGVVASRVGKDELGRAATQRLESLGLGTASIQLDGVHSTGAVKVTVSSTTPQRKT